MIKFFSYIKQTKNYIKFTSPVTAIDGMDIFSASSIYDSHLQ